MTRRCSHCSNNGHNSRTCPSRGGVKLFGVRLTDGSSIKKSASMGNLSSAHHHSPSSPSFNPGSPHDPFREAIHETEGYLSDDPNHASCSSNRRNDRKKGVPWTEEEHRLFLIGLQKLGKGDWRGIARNFVMSRSPTQVASHAQKYFIRQSNAPRRKRRSSLFDMVADSATDQPSVPEEQHFQSAAADNANSLPSLNLSLKAEQEPMDATASNEIAEQTEETLAYSSEYPTNVPPFFPAFLPLSFPLWRPNAALPDEEKDTEPPHHEVLKPIPTISKEPLNVDVGLSHLSLVETENGDMEPLPLSLKLPAVPSRQSAFHANVPVGDGAGLRKGKASAIQAV